MKYYNSEYDVLSPTEQINLVKKAQNGDNDAVETLCKTNTKLVLKWARYYLSPISTTLDLDDLMQAGYMGLIKAIELFDVNGGTKFSTYAVPWIKQRIIRTIQQESENIRIPVGRYQTLYGLKQIIEKYKNEYGYIITDEELYEITQQKGQPKYLAELTLDKIIKLKKYLALFNPVSLDTPVGEDQEEVIGDFIKSSSPTPEEIVVDKSMRNNILNIIKQNKKIKPEHKDIFLEYYLDDTATLETIGYKHNLTRERIRQICLKVINILKYDIDMRKLYQAYSNKPVRLNNSRGTRKNNVKRKH